MTRVLQGLAGLSGSCRACRFLQGVLGLAGCPGSCRVFWVLQGVQGLAGSSWSCRASRVFRVFLSCGVPGQAPGGGPISSCVAQTAVSDYSHTVRAPQSRAFLQAVSRPCPRTIQWRGLQYPRTWKGADGCLLTATFLAGAIFDLLTFFALL